MCSQATEVVSTDSLLERLPLLALELICEFLSRSGSRRRSLFAFSLTSKRCCAAAERERFDRILLSAGNQQQVEEAITRCNHILTVGSRKRYVRRIKIIGSMMIDADEVGAVWTDYHKGFRDRVLEARNEVGRAEALAGEDSSSRLGHSGNLYGSVPECTEENKARCNQGWGPLAAFVPTLPGLKELIWASTDQVPRCIMDTLHESLPSLRLTVQTFSLRSLYQKHGQFHDIDPDEYVLASSPNLYSIFVSSERFDSEGNLNYNQEAVQHMVTGIAPNLRSVTLCAQHAGNSPFLHEAVMAGRPPWRGFFADEQGSTQKSGGSLERLAFHGHYQDGLQTWAAYTDLLKLRSLHLRTIIHAEGLQKLAEVAVQGMLANVEMLSVRLGWDNEEIEENERLSHWSKEFFSALPHLRGLFVRNPMIRSTTSVVLARHGASLRRLHLGNIAEIDEVEEMYSACPAIQTLHLGIKRSAGDDREVFMYRTLGSFSRLEELSLDLHYTYDLSFEEESDGEKVAQQMRSELINAAIDAEIAVSIFRLVFAANRTTRQGISPSFHHLTIRGVGHHHWVHQLSTLIDWLAHSWSCKLQRPDAEVDAVIVQELDAGWRTRRGLERSVGGYVQENFKSCQNGELIRPTWETIWPESQGKSDWFKFWHSLPLALE